MNELNDDIIIGARMYDDLKNGTYYKKHYKALRWIKYFNKGINMIETLFNLQIIETADLILKEDKNQFVIYKDSLIIYYKREVSEWRLLLSVTIDKVTLVKMFVDEKKQDDLKYFEFWDNLVSKYFELHNKERDDKFNVIEDKLNTISSGWDIDYKGK